MHTHWMAGVSACVCAAALCHSSAVWRPHPLWAMCQKFIFASSVSSPHSTQTSRMQTIHWQHWSPWAYRNWLHKCLYLNSSHTQLKITDLKTKLYFQSNGMSEQDSLRDKFACKRVRQKCGHQWINWKLWLMGVSSSSTANYIKKVMHVRSLFNLFLWNELLSWSSIELRMLLHTVLGSCKPESISVINSSFKLDSRLMMSSMTSSICAYRKEREKTV